MKEWTAARDHVNEVRKNDARTAEKLSKEITEVGTKAECDFDSSKGLTAACFETTAMKISCRHLIQ